MTDTCSDFILPKDAPCLSSSSAPSGGKEQGGETLPMTGRWSHSRGLVHQGHWRASDAALDEVPDKPGRRYAVERDGTGYHGSDGKIFYHDRTQLKIVKPLNKREIGRYHTRHMKRETAAFRAAAEEEGFSVGEFRRIIDNAKKAAKGEVTARETANEPPRPAATAPSASSALAWPTAKWKDATEKVLGKKLGIVIFLKREWEPFIQNSGQVVTRDLLAMHDRDAEQAFTRHLETHAFPEGISIVYPKQLMKLASKRPDLVRAAFGVKRSTSLHNSHT